MWFVLLAIALSIVVVGGLYLRLRLDQALAELFHLPRGRRVVRWVVPYLLYGYPLLVFAYVGISLALGRETFRMQGGALVEWLLAMPFFWAVLVTLQAIPFLLVFDLVHFAGLRRSASWPAIRAALTLGVLGAFAVYTPLRIAWEAGSLEVRHHELQREVPSGPQLRIAFFADLQQDHNTTAERAAEVVSAIDNAGADLVVSGGDWINSGPDYIGAVKETAAALRSAPHGPYSVRGDHEHFAFRDRQRSVDAVTLALGEGGVEMLHNEVRRFHHEGLEIAVVFLSYNYIFRTPKAETEALLASVQGADYAILVTHQFDGPLADLAKNRVNLVLAGHTHGGQVNPVFFLRHVPIARVETPYVDGHYRLGSTDVIVTSGIGFSIAPFRYASPASVEIIDIDL